MQRAHIAPSGSRPQDEKNVYVDVYRLLILGMLISTALFVIGLVLALLHPKYYPLSANWLRQQYHWETIVHAFRTGDPTGFMLLATVVLILTPVTRVIVSIWAFLVDRDYRFAAVTGTVLAIILLSMLLGRLGLQ